MLYWCFWLAIEAADVWHRKSQVGKNLLVEWHLCQAPLGLHSVKHYFCLIFQQLNCTFYEVFLQEYPQRPGKKGWSCNNCTWMGNPHLASLAFQVFQMSICRSDETFPHQPKVFQWYCFTWNDIKLANFKSISQLQCMQICKYGIRFPTPQSLDCLNWYSHF